MKKMEYLNWSCRLEKNNKKKGIVIASPHSRHDFIETSLRKKIDLEILRIRKPNELTSSMLSTFSPRYIFFPHWSWIIPEKIYKKFDCVIFHMTDLPFGRGGSPLQNLIVRGLKETKLTAFRCDKTLDAGPIYLKRPLSLMGTAEEILLRAANLTETMIEQILREEPLPIEQTGKPTEFRRRLPEESNLASLDELEKLFDYIRMLDADIYPAAFIETEHFIFNFTHATMKSDDAVVAEVKIIRKNS